MKICKNYFHICKPLKSPLGVLILTKILKNEDFQELLKNFFKFNSYTQSSDMAAGHVQRFEYMNGT